MKILQLPTRHGAEALAAHCLEPEDFEEASNDLLTLDDENKSLARDVALRILRERIGDVFYRGSAFFIMYSSAFFDALAYIESDAGTESAAVLAKILDCVTNDVGLLKSLDEADEADDADSLALRDGILKAVSLLRSVLLLRSREDLELMATEVAEFERVYSFLQSTE